MDDATLVRCRERVGDLDGVTESLIHRQLAAREALSQGLAVQIFHHQEPSSALVPNIENRADVRVRERSNRSGLAVKAMLGIWLASEVREENLDRYDAVQACIARFIHLAHPPGTDRGQDLIRTKSRARREDHRGCDYTAAPRHPVQLRSILPRSLQCPRLNRGGVTRTSINLGCGLWTAARGQEPPPVNAGVRKYFGSFRVLRGSQAIRVTREAACAGRSREWAACSAAG